MKGIYEKDSNFFAIRKVYEGTFDGTTWFGAGDVMYYGKKMLESVILKVECDGSVVVENEKGIFSCSVKEMKSGHMTLGKSSDSEHDGLLAVRYRNQFTIDFSNWFSEEQKCIIKTNTVTYVGANIEYIMPNGNIHISLEDKDEIIHYSEIKNIKDFYDNTHYIFMEKRSRIKSPVIIKNHFVTSMKDCY